MVELQLIRICGVLFANFRCFEVTVKFGSLRLGIKRFVGWNGSFCFFFVFLFSCVFGLWGGREGG